ncbi:MAG: hydroxymethylbilane synthase [Bacillota bacterium]
MKKLILGTRGSRLALTQARLVSRIIKKNYNNIDIKLKKIKTTGDRIKDTPLYDKGGKGLFIKEIEKALLNEEIDLAVHSLKDVPGEIGKQFSLLTFPRREDPRDVLISKNNLTLKSLPENASLGTGSLRRQNQLKKYRSDFKFINIRGNIDTRLKKLNKMDLDGIILAAAGLHRINKNGLITQYITKNICVPAVGQGTLGIEILNNRVELTNLLSVLKDLKTSLQSKAERAFLQTLNGSCKLPLGGYMEVKLNKAKVNFKMYGFLSDIEGNSCIFKTLKGEINCENLEKKELESKFKKIGKKMADIVLNTGGEKIINKILDHENRKG